MNIRRFTRTTITTSILGTLVVAGLASGQAGAAERCFEPGPDGLPQEVPCPIEIVTPPVPEFTLPGFADISAPGTLGSPVGEPAEEPCVITLPSGVEVPCDLSIVLPSDVTGLGDILVDADPDALPEDDPMDDAEEAEVVDAAESPDEAPETSTDSTDADSPEEAPAADEEPESEPTEDVAEVEATEDAAEVPAEREPEADPADSADPADPAADDSTEVEAADTDEPATGPLPSTGPAAAGILFGLGLMGIGGGTFAKLAANRRRR